MTKVATIESIRTEGGGTATADFYTHALALGDHVRAAASDAPTSGFRGFTLSLVVSQPSVVNAFIDAAADAGGKILAPPKKSLWGYGGTVEAPDGTIVTIAASKKKDNGPADETVDSIVLQLGVDDVAASKDFYTKHGFAVAKSYGSKYVEFATGDITLAVLKRKMLAKNAGVPPEGEGSHRVTIVSAAGPFTDPDGFVWEPK